MQKMIDIAKKLSVEKLKLEIVRYHNDFSEIAEIVLSALMPALESKISESEYVEFCNALADAESIAL
ncbi:MAG: hypothetical protein ACYC0M_15760 [Burkholderiales bacterium]